MTERGFHPFAVLHFLRKTILLYLLPLLPVSYTHLNVKNAKFPKMRFFFVQGAYFPLEIRSALSD